MKFSRLPTGVIVTFGFIGVIAVSYLIIYLLKDVPRPEELCEQKCSAINRASRMVLHNPTNQAIASGRPAPMKCECY